LCGCRKTSSFCLDYVFSSKGTEFGGSGKDANNNRTVSLNKHKLSFRIYVPFLKTYYCSDKDVRVKTKQDDLQSWKVEDRLEDVIQNWRRAAEDKDTWGLILERRERKYQEKC